MKTQIRNRTLANRTALVAATLVGLGLAAMTPAAATAADPAAMTTKPPIIAYSKVLKAVEHRPDFGVLEGVHYNTQMRAWDFHYTKDDGLPTVVKIDAVTGTQITMFGAAQQ